MPAATTCVLCLMILAFSFIFYSLYYATQTSKFMTGDQVVENYFTTAFIGCVIIVAAIVIVIAAEVKRVEAKKR
jgi:hypothetical protein